MWSWMGRRGREKKEMSPLPAVTGREPHHLSEKETHAMIGLISLVVLRSAIMLLWSVG